MNIYITLDYELYLNDITGDVDSCLVTPTCKLLRILKKHNILATFFIDASFLDKLKELAFANGGEKCLMDDYNKIVANLKEIVNNGHAIGLHLHPQWFYSEFDGKEWKMDFDHYKLSDMPSELADRKFRECFMMLKEICGTEITSFRAGGYSIQGYSNFAKLMKDCGILRDSSVLFKMKNKSHLHYFDYTSINNSDIYTFSECVTTPTTSGLYKEYPISTEKIHLLKYCQLRYQSSKFDDNSNWGNGGDLPGKKQKNFLKNIVKKTKWWIQVPATIDYQSFIFFHHIFESYLNNKKKDFVIIGHPKNFSPASLKMLDSFIEIEKSNHTFNTI